MNMHAAVKTYAKVDMESNAHSSDPHKLILMLYQGALLSIASGKNHMQRKEIPEKGQCISQAISIINDGLKASLDLNVGGSLARNLSDLYDYMIQRLLFANLKNDVNALEEVSTLLLDLRGAWEAIRQTEPSPAKPVHIDQPPPTKTLLVYGKM